MGKRARISSTDLTRLKIVPFLRGASDHELAAISQLVDEVAIAEGQVLIAEGGTARQAFVILEGWAAVTVRDEPIAALGPGEVIGEVGMIDHGPRTATVVAKTPMRVLVIGPDAFGTFIGSRTVATGVTRGLAERLRRADHQIATAHESAQR